MRRFDAGRQPRPRVPDRTETADLRVAVWPGSPLVVEIRGEIDIQSAPELRDELLRVIRRCGPRVFALGRGPRIGGSYKTIGGRPWSLAEPPG